MNRMVNYIRLACKLACVLKTYRTRNSTVGFSKYEFNNKLSGGVILFRVTLGVTWTQPYIYSLKFLVGKSLEVFIFWFLFCLDLLIRSYENYPAEDIEMGIFSSNCPFW